MSLIPEQQSAPIAVPTNEELAAANIHIFLEHYQITNDQGGKLDFYDHPFMWDIFEDWSSKIVGKKAAQITWSTCFNIKALYAANYFGIDIIYTLPSGSDVKDFVGGKTNRLIANNPIFQKWTTDKDSIEQKKVGGNIIYFRGTWTERAAIAIPADLYICDEKDRSKQDIVATYSSRLQHSKFGWEWEFSNPSAPGHGVDKTWGESDQKHWFIKCDACQYEWYITMDNVMYKDPDHELEPYFGCLQCKAELNRRKGRWIAKYKGREISGYWISLLMAPWVTANKILELKRTKTEEYFANFVLGDVYIGKNNVLTAQAFEQNLTPDLNAQDSRPIIGVDTGVGINVVVTNKYGTFFYDKTDGYEQVENMLTVWPTAICVIDQGGDIIGPRKLREKFPNRVFLCFFKSSGKNDTLITWNDDEGTVIVDRDRLIQLVVDEFVERRMPVYGTALDWKEYKDEWLGMYRTMEEDKLGVAKYHWNKPSSGRCDYPFASVYARVGLDRFMETASTFHEPTVNSFAQPGLDVQPDGKAFLPKHHVSGSI